MSKIGKISVIPKTYSQNFKSYESSLAAAGYTRAPGTHRYFIPFKERNGKYRTGLDETAQYLQKLPKEEKELEIKRIKEDKARLEDLLGVKGILASDSPFWNWAAPTQQLVQKFGVELRIDRVPVGNGDFLFDLSDPIKEVTWNWMKVHPQIAPSLEAYQRGDCAPDCQYYVADEDAQNKATYSRKKLINQAIVKFESLIPSKKKKVARLMGLPVSDNTTEESVYNQMDSLLKETEFKSGEFKSLSPITIFNEIVNLKDSILEVKDLIEEAIRYSVYRIGVNGKITEGGLDIAVDKNSLLEYLLSDEHQNDLIILKKKVSEKKHA